jgi:2'-5' RNA ligase
VSTTAATGSGDGVRAFLALLPAPASRGLRHPSRAKQERAHAGAARSVRWIESGATHLTLCFLGTTRDAQVEYFRHVLPTLASTLPAIAAQRYGIWPNRARPRLLVLELESDPHLLELVRQCELHARKAGFAPETRSFRAHVTLARLRPGCAFGTLPSPPRAIGFEAVALMQSTLTQPAATHTELASVAIR